MALADHIIRHGPAGDIVETGVFTGGTAIAMLAVLEARAARTTRLWAADSFRGLPEVVHADASCAERTVGGISSNECVRHKQPGDFSAGRALVERNIARHSVERHRLRVVEGWFNETLPTPGMRRAGIAMIRLDGDLYASTRDALAALYPLLRRGGLVYVDDYGSFPGCARAIDEYRNAHGISAKLHSIDEGNGRFEAVYWQKR